MRFPTSTEEAHTLPLSPQMVVQKCHFAVVALAHKADFFVDKCLQ